MKVLIVHDYLDNLGGGEKLMLSLAKGLDADFATLDYNPRVVEKAGFSEVNIIDLGSTVKTPPLKQIHASLKYSFLKKFSGYDCFVFSGNWAHYGARLNKPSVYYCHTPTRAFYDQYENMKRRLCPGKKFAFKSWVKFHRVFDKRSVKNLDAIVANSLNVQGRIKKFHGLDSVVVNPGVDTAKYFWSPESDFWLSVNRIYPEKRVDMQIEAFRQMPDLKLKIAGGLLKGDHAGSYYEELIEDLPENVELLGTLDEEDLIGLYSRCRGLVCTAIDEDFGMTPIEAMASGKPVVAVEEGGFKETLIDGVTGRFCKSDVESVVHAVREVDEKPSAYKDGCMNQAGKFDTQFFIEKMREIIGEVTSN